MTTEKPVLENSIKEVLRDTLQEVYECCGNYEGTDCDLCTGKLLVVGEISRRLNIDIPTLLQSKGIPTKICGKCQCKENGLDAECVYPLCVE